MHENIQNGRACESGVAVINAAAKQMTCVKISSIKTNLDNYVANQPVVVSSQDILPGAARCNLATSPSCKYMYKDAAGADKLINQEHCECSL